MLPGIQAGIESSGAEVATSRAQRSLPGMVLLSLGRKSQDTIIYLILLRRCTSMLLIPGHLKIV